MTHTCTCFAATIIIAWVWWANERKLCKPTRNSGVSVGNRCQVFRTTLRTQGQVHGQLLSQVIVIVTFTLAGPSEL